jgi:hypothetical protein
MARQVRLLNSYLLVVGLLLSLFGCRQQNPRDNTIPAQFVSALSLGWQRHEGQLWLNGEPFSGWQYQLWPDGDTSFVGAFYEGKAEGLHRYWYADQRQKEIRHYQNGWQEGEQRGWFESGKLAFVYHFRNDIYEGRCQEWYQSGQPAQDKHYQNGQESGSQKMWFAEGSLKANYVARNGRNYGFTGVKNCINVWDSIAVSH